jgi:hypothetical protein
MEKNKKKEIDLEKREFLKKLGALGLGSAFGLILGKLAFAQQFGHDASEIISGTLAKERLPTPTNASVTDTTERSTTSTTWVDHPALTLNITLNKESLVIVSVTIPRVVNTTRGCGGNFQILCDGTVLSYGYYRHVSGTYVDAESQENALTLVGMKVLPAGTYTIKLQWYASGGGTLYAKSSWTGAITGQLFVAAIPG